MTIRKFGRLEPVDLRLGWVNEANEFTPWLAREENIALLGDTIGLDLEVEAVEKNVGPFRADIVCKDTVTDNWVLIENQLERTDHNHLGQLLTYAAGLNAVTIVWIADRFTDEHRAALDWLNEITSEVVNFFGLEIELWRIGDSAMAPKFNIVSKPNDWLKTVVASRQPTHDDLSDTQKMQLDFWTGFKQFLEENSQIIRSRKPFPQHWMDFAIGRAYFHLSATIHTQENRLATALTMHGPDKTAHFNLLWRQKDMIENEIGLELDWMENPDKKSSYIYTYNFDFDVWNRAQWPTQYQWLCNTLETFHRSLGPRVKSLDASDYVAERETIP